MKLRCNCSYRRIKKNKLNIGILDRQCLGEGGFVGDKQGCLSAVALCTTFMVLGRGI